MTQKNELARLHRIAALIRDVRMNDLRAARADVARLRAQVSRFDEAYRADALPESLSRLPAYTQWDRQARAALNIRLAAMLAHESRCAEAARLAFGRAAVLKGLQKTTANDQAS